MAAKDAYLTRAVITERFNLVNCSQIDALKVTMPWRDNPDILHNLMYAKTAYSSFAWARHIGRMDGRTRFVHAIVAREIRGTIGAHRIVIDDSGTASMSIVVHTKAWRGQGVFAEARAGLLDHFSQSPRVTRFFGRVLARNVSSIYNYTKLGFRVIGHDTKSWKSPLTGEHHDTVHFEYLAEDWRKKRGLTSQ